MYCATSVGWGTCAVERTPCTFPFKNHKEISERIVNVWNPLPDNVDFSIGPHFRSLDALSRV